MSAYLLIVINICNFLSSGSRRFSNSLTTQQKTLNSCHYFDNPSFLLPPHFTHNIPQVTTHSCLATIFYPLATGPTQLATGPPHVQSISAIQPQTHTTHNFRFNNLSKFKRKMSSLTSIFSFSSFANAELCKMSNHTHQHNQNHFQPFLELFSFSF